MVRIAQSDSEWRTPAFALAAVVPGWDGAVHVRRSAATRLGAEGRDADEAPAGRRSRRRPRTCRPARPRGGPPTTPGARRASQLPFSARITGHVKQTQEPGGAIVDLSLRLSGGAHGRLRIRLAGAPLGGGGLSMTGSQVDLLADGLPSVLEGRITSLQGQQFVARVADSSGSKVNLHADLNIDQNSGNVTGRLARQFGGWMTMASPDACSHRIAARRARRVSRACSRGSIRVASTMTLADHERSTVRCPGRPGRS